ncbi:MAG: 16S rRNA (guanine(527)-N(7))-methyltransferase RsmG [Xylophilus ampelinus]
MADSSTTHSALSDSRALLHEGVAALGLELDAARLQKLLDFLALLQKWNKVYNLTAVRDPAEMLTHHLLDSLAVVAPLLRQRAAGGNDPAAPFRVLDVGAGAGLPGAVIATCLPQAWVTCVDTVAKKAAFQQQVALELKLPNLRGLHARVETIAEGHEVVTSRAFAALSDFTRWSIGALAPDGVWMAMKGRHPADEIAALPADAQVFHVEPLTVPGLDAERCIVWMRRPAANAGGH